MNIDNDKFIDSEEEMFKNKNHYTARNQLLTNVLSDESEDEVFTLNKKNENEIFNTENIEDFCLPHDKAWGKEKKAYYSTDYIDSDYAFTSQKDIDNAEIEEQEAKNLQNRLTVTLDESDYGLDLIDIKQYHYNLKNNNEHIKADISRLSKRQKYEFLQKENPELVPLISDFKECLGEAKMILKPFLDSIKNYYQDCFEVNIIKIKYNLLLHYCMNISFYLIMKSNGESVVTHPVIKRLAQYRHLLALIQQNHGNLIQKFIKISEIKNNSKTLKYPTDIDKTNSQVTILSKKVSEIFKDSNFNSNIVKSELPKTILNTDNEKNVENTENTQDININEHGQIERHKRSITYQIAKNRGLTPYKKKEQRNPRVKHKNKYRKAKICRKGSVREVRKETSRYGGELSGIKASVTKSIKLK